MTAKPSPAKIGSVGIKMFSGVPPLFCRKTLKVEGFKKLKR
jgi:hypothetical protein